MALLLVLLPAETKDCLRPEALSALARLGATSVALVRDKRLLGLVVEGWAFDPIGSAEAVMAAVATRGQRARAPQPVVEMTLTEGEGR